MKRLKVLALSDLHLGEPEGLLYDEGVNIQDVVLSKVSELASGREGFEDGIEELILIGDIADLSEARPDEAYRNTKTFLTALMGRVKVDKVIYIPGNHDHHMWVEMLKAYYGKDDYEGCSPKTGRFAIHEPKILKEKCIPKDYKGRVEAHYPFYQIKIGDSHFLFDHGHLFSSLLNRMAGPVTSLEEMEEKTWEFMEFIWFQEGNAPWFYRFREWTYDWARWFAQRATHPTRGVSFKEDSTPVFDDGLRDRLVRYLEKMVGLSEAETQDFHLIFGHTHYGGRVLRDDRKVRINGRFITLWNTGGWLVPSEVFSPDAYIFYIGQASDVPKMYKLVARVGSEEGDYDRAVLKEIVEGIG